MATTITRASVAQVPTGGLDALFRASIEDGSATVLVADRKADRNQADVRVRADKAITVVRAMRAIALREAQAAGVDYVSITAQEVRDMGLNPNSPARGELRAAYLRAIG